MNMSSFVVSKYEMNYIMCIHFVWDTVLTHTSSTIEWDVDPIQVEFITHLMMDRAWVSTVSLTKWVKKYFSSKMLFKTWPTKLHPKTKTKIKIKRNKTSHVYSTGQTIKILLTCIQIFFLYFVNLCIMKCLIIWISNKRIKNTQRYR